MPFSDFSPTAAFDLLFISSLSSFLHPRIHCPGITDTLFTILAGADKWLRSYSLMSEEDLTSEETVLKICILNDPEY